MVEVYGVEKLLSVTPKKRFGKFRLYGTSQFGHSDYGAEDIVCFPDGYDAEGQDRTPKLAPINFSGIYRTDNVTGRTKFYREPYYITKNPRTVPQQAWRGIFADSVSAWQGLTDEQKAVYNIRAKGKRMSGYNLFLKEYLSLH
jgi:hypothetical protein